MNKNLKGFIQYCRNKIKDNNKKIKGLRNQVSEYEAIIEVITRTDINKQILDDYKQKINLCFNKIDRYMESNKNNYDLISVMKRTNGIIKENNKTKVCN